MAKSVSLAKISRPRIFGVVARQRLFELLDEQCKRPLVWLSAPPGAGKTALVASYLENRERPVIWYQMDPGDSDPAAFFLYISKAAKNHIQSEALSLPRFVPEHLRDLTSFARLFFRAFFEALPDNVILALDNCQELPESAPIQDVVRQCIAELPVSCTVIAISRTHSPKPFVSLKASGHLVSIDWETIRFSLDEVRALCLERRVTDEWLLQALHQQSHGWAAGITLMLERLGHLDGQQRELPADSNESVFEYFASLIFDQTSEVDREILLCLAYLPNVTPSLAVEVSERQQAPALLEDLYRRRLFTDRRQGVEPVYQFHSLFLDFLRNRAREAFSQDRLMSLIKRSASALERSGESESAMRLWFDAQSWQEAIRLLLSVAQGFLDSGRRETLAQWIQTIPDSVKAGEPWLEYWLGCTHLQTNPLKGMQRLEESLVLFRQSNNRVGCVECLASLLRGAFLGFGALDAMDHWLDALLAEIDAQPEFSSTESELRIRSVLRMALFHVRPWHPLTTTMYQLVAEMLPACSDPSVALSAAMSALHVSTFCEDFERADRIALATERFALRDAASPSEAAWWFGQVGYLRFMEARYDEALANLSRGCGIAQSNGLGEVLKILLSWRFTLEIRVVGWSAATKTLAEIEGMPRSEHLMLRTMISMCQARKAIHQGRKDEAAKLAAASTQAAIRMGSRFEEILFWLTNAEILLEAGCAHQARPLIQQCQTSIERTPMFDSFRAVIALLEAWSAYVEDGPDRALNKLRSALALARERKRRYYLRLLWCSLPVLFALALREEIETDLVQDIIRMFLLRPPKDAPDNWPWPVRIQTLGQFGLDVNGEPVQFSRKLPLKVLRLLKAIIAHGGRDVPEQALCDALWQDEEGDAANSAFAITLVRLRKLLGTSDAVIQLGGKISLNAELCWIDSWAFEAQLDQSPDLKILDLYRGTFLPEDTDQPWTVAPRERLRGKFIHALSVHGAALESNSDLDGAVTSYRRGIDADPIVESFHQGLMRCYDRLGRRTEAISVYRRMRQTLSVLLGVPPSEESQRLYEKLLRDQRVDGAPDSIREASNIACSRAPRLR